MKKETIVENSGILYVSMYVCITHVLFYYYIIEFLKNFWKTKVRGWEFYTGCIMNVNF